MNPPHTHWVNRSLPPVMGDVIRFAAKQRVRTRKHKRIQQTLLQIWNGSGFIPYRNETKFSWHCKEEPSGHATDHFTEMSNETAKLDEGPYTFWDTHMGPSDPVSIKPAPISFAFICSVDKFGLIRWGYSRSKWVPNYLQSHHTTE